MYSNNNLTKQEDEVDGDFVERIFALTDEEFCKLAPTRLNIRFLSSHQPKDREIAENKREYWTQEYFVDKMFLQIAGTKETIKYNGKNLTIYKYYNQALRLFHWIPITKPTAEFVLKVSDLTPRIVAELKSLEKASCDYVLRQSGRTNI